MESVSLSQANVHKAQNVLQIAMVRLEEESRNLLVVHSEPLDPELVLNPVSMVLSRSLNESFQDRPSHSSDDDEAEEEEEEAVSHPLTEKVCEMNLIPQDVIPDLHRIKKKDGFSRIHKRVYASLWKHQEIHCGR